MQTYTGRQFFPLDPRPEEVHIEDIAHHLSQRTRYGGAALEFYSVGQHSVEVSHACDEPLWGLLHDAAEAYVGDMIRPIKHTPEMAAFRRIEKRVQAAVCIRYGLAIEEPRSVKEADGILLATERRDLLAPLAASEEDWLHGAESFGPLPWSLHAMPPRRAEHEFLARFNNLSQ